MNFSVFIDVGDLLTALGAPDPPVLVYPLLVPDHVGVFRERLPALLAPGQPLSNLTVGPPPVLGQVIELLVTSLASPSLRHSRPQNFVDHPKMLVDV